MSNELYETREAMLSIAHPERWLRLADSQLKAWEEQRDQFILPREQVLIKPIIEYYAGDAEGWARFVRSVWVMLPRGSPEKAEVFKFLRTLEVRVTQRWRRELLDRAVAKAIQLGWIKDTVTDKARYEKRCTQQWMARRRQLLEGRRQQSSSGHLNVAEREVLLKEFWKMVEQEIDAGEGPTA